MDTATRSSFLQQLSLWATKHISAGRSPFRKAQIRPQIITRAGTQQPDLVFWINKDSFVSGGFILCLDNDTFDLDRAQACAHALGLSYFASWGACNITVWQASSCTPYLEWPAPRITGKTITNPFEDALIELMDQFRTLAVLGTCPPQKLSYWHLTNLFLATTNKSQMALTKSLRSQPGGHNKYLPTAHKRAQDKIHLCIARMLALTYLECIPHNLQPENLDSGLKDLISERGTKDFTCLAVQTGEADLDEKSAVALHHLLHRLGQVAVFHDPKRALKLLEQLLIHSAPYTGAAVHVPCPSSTIYLYCNNTAEPQDETGTHIEVDTPARMAIKHLMRKLAKNNSYTHHVHTVFALPAQKRPVTVSGFLYNHQRPDIKHRNNWLQNIKLAWSGAFFDLPRTAPTWAYEFIYVLGILAPHSTLNLNMPTELFASPYSATLVAVLQDSFTLHTLRHNHDGMVTFAATKESDDAALTLFAGQQQRALPWSQLSTAKPDFFAQELHLNPNAATAYPHTGEFSTPPQHNRTPVTSALRQQLIHLAELAGVPQFPEQYLFDYYRPQLTGYTRAAHPWHIKTEFMGTFQLQPKVSDADSPTLNIDNDYLACAIVLASWSNLDIELPEDLAIVEKIVTRYLTDLSELHRSIWSAAHAAIPRHEAANRLVNKTWKALGLPSWKTVEEFRTRFLIP